MNNKKIFIIMILLIIAVYLINNYSGKIVRVVEENYEGQEATGDIYEQAEIQGMTSVDEEKIEEHQARKTAFLQQIFTYKELNDFNNLAGLYGNNPGTAIVAIGNEVRQKSK